MARISKDKIDLDTTLINVSVILKGFRQKLDIYTTATESTEFVDWLNNNPAIHSYKVQDKDKFTNKYFIFNDYKKKKTICINRNEIKEFEVPFISDISDSDIEFKILYVQ
ncbi:hypothetical protein KM792_04235 [Clostridium tyrobutyricum]|uniref:hypothetical protein n=1 Tax=Clostridium tyrobutyricum TaxID=1519 RepID=UPI001C39580C|nr:hypothetical protein [Clostridium tyrobutyricum]MBV4448876.1 hypothetical protein [Clostridium tyrobutyricum]